MKIESGKMAGRDTASGVVNSTRFPSISKSLWDGPLSLTALVNMDVSFKTKKIKAVWLSEIGDAT